MKTPLQNITYRLLMLLVFLLAGVSHALVVRLPDGSFHDGCGTFQQDPARTGRVARPSLPYSYATQSGHFRIHYAVTGDDAVDAADTDGDGIPDWVTFTGSILDSIYAQYELMGYQTLLGDNGDGGGYEYDVYLRELSYANVYGYTRYGIDSYLELDDDYAERIYLGDPYNSMRVTVAHELFHAVQFTYYAGSEGRWWQEATAVFMEDVMYPDINDYWQYLNPDYFGETFFDDPATGLASYGSSGSAVNIYGASVFVHFLNQSKPCCGKNSVRQTFERQESANSASVSLIIDALEDGMHRSIEELLADFWMWSYFSGGRTIPGLFFTDAAGYHHPPPSGLDNDQWQVTDVSDFGQRSGTIIASFLGGHIMRIPPDGSEGGVRVEVESRNGADWDWSLAVREDDRVTVYQPEDGAFEVAGWNKVDDIVLTAGNGELSGTDHRFTYTVTHDVNLTRPTLPALVVELEQNRPNPFNPGTEIPFTLNVPGYVTVGVYDITGRRIRQLVNERYYETGQHSVFWDGITENGRDAGTGVYFTRARAGSSRDVQRMLLIR